MKKLGLISFVTLFALSTLGFASNDFKLPVSLKLNTEKPRHCPQVTELVAGSVGRGVILLNGQYYAGHRHKDYDTYNVWTFILGPINAVSQEDAYRIALFNLPSLYFLFGPQRNQGNWYCMYNTTHGIPAVAITPPLDTMPDISNYLR